MENLYFEHMGPNNQMHDINFCLLKETEYYAKVRAATNPKIKTAYEAIAKEYAYRAAMLRDKKNS
jgi:hypothetical protein